MTETRTLKLKNKLGMHARAAAAFVKVAQQFKAKVYIERDGQIVNGDSILDILTLACPYGGKLTIKAEGVDAFMAIEELGKLIENKFGEV
ncbi:MAG: HPr family phosphocarrier protein [Deltaproteobacteria bacterium]|nr:HPr family phosphocarrier protein [Deltaproteobacteria bacterium]